MLDGKLNQFINPEVKAPDIELKPAPELIKKVMDQFGVNEKEAIDYIIEGRKKIKEKNEMRKKEEYKEAA